ncbi:hypothetical protein KI387_021455 [Taxus chinensis]|uniref:Uncharacterized protein n=1 Tax=Taxus chinensis TaxID=29808 RepID=A0AA38LDD4_TAXCH|nr:hypothetical protein KI387_021455 [Taxus chinensis]
MLAYHRHGLLEDALILFHQMQRTDAQPDHFTFASILPACANRRLGFGAPGGKVYTKGTIYLSNVRMVFVANKPVGAFVAFDLPLVVPEDANRALFSTHSFKIIFKEGGCGTFVPWFFNLIRSVRQYHQMSVSAADVTPRADPLQVGQPPVDEMMRCAQTGFDTAHMGKHNGFEFDHDVDLEELINTLEVDCTTAAAIVNSKMGMKS